MSFKVGDKAIVTGPLKFAASEEPGGVHLIPGEEVEVLDCFQGGVFVDGAGDDVLVIGSQSDKAQYIDVKSLTPVAQVGANPYPPDELGEYDDDDGTMPNNVEELSEAVVGHRIVSAERAEVDGKYWGRTEALVLTLDNGTKVQLADTDDCCAYTSLEKFLLHPERVDHIITGVATTEGYTRWHIFADFGDVLELEVGWSCGNPFYYGYGFDINVVNVDD